MIDGESFAVDDWWWMIDGEWLIMSWLIMNWLMVNWLMVNDWWWIIYGAWLMVNWLTVNDGESFSVNDWWWIIDGDSFTVNHCTVNTACNCRSHHVFFCVNPSGKGCAGRSGKCVKSSSAIRAMVVKSMFCSSHPLSCWDQGWVQRLTGAMSAMKNPGCFSIQTKLSNEKGPLVVWVLW